jgi:hypothetical protein
MAVPSSVTSLVTLRPELAEAALRAAALIVPDTAILMWNDLRSDPPLITWLMIEFGSFGLAATAVAPATCTVAPGAPLVAPAAPMLVAPAGPLAPPAVGAALPPLQAAATTRMSAAKTDKAGLGTRAKV